MKRFTQKYWRHAAIMVVAVVAVVVAVGLRVTHPFRLSTGTVEAASADTITFGLNASGGYGQPLGSVRVTANNSSETVTSTEVNFTGVKYIAPFFSNSGKGTFKTDFKIGVQVCEYPGTNCGIGWTDWASDIAQQGFDVYSAPAVFVSADPSHDRFNYVTIYLQTRPLPAGTQFQAEVGERLEEYDYVFPNTPWMEGANVSEPFNAYCGGTFTPPGGGTGSSVGAEERLGTCRGHVISSNPDVIELTIDAYDLESFNASYVHTNIPSTFNVGETKTVDASGNQLEITMKNTGTALWPMGKGAATGTPSGTCQVDVDGSGINDAPSATSSNGGKSCTTNFIYSTTYVLSHSGSFGVVSSSAQAIKVVPITITYTGPKMISYRDPGYCPMGNNSTLLNDKSPFFPSAYASFVSPGCIATTWFQVMDDGNYSYSYGASINIVPEDEATFILNSLTAPSSNGVYNETWQMESNGTPFGASTTIPITVGNPGPTYPINVTSYIASTTTPVPASYFLSGGGLDVNVPTSSEISSATYQGTAGDNYTIGGVTTTVPGLSLKNVVPLDFAQAHHDALSGLLAVLGEPLGEIAHAQTITVTDHGFVKQINSYTLRPPSLTFAITWTSTTQHLACVNNACTSVAGSGANQDGCAVVGQACSGGGSTSTPNPPSGGQRYACQLNGSCIPSSAGAYTSSNCNNACVASGNPTSTQGPGNGVVPTCSSFTASSTTILPGEASTLSWTCSTGSCNINGNNVPVSGTSQVSPTTTTLYTLSCVNGNGSVSTSTTVIVNNPNQIEINP
jgi:hypothetical protein